MEVSFERLSSERERYMTVLSIVSYNIQRDRCESFKGHWAKIPELRDADIIALQEVPSVERARDTASLRNFLWTCEVNSEHINRAEHYERFFNAIFLQAGYRLLKKVNISLRPRPGKDLLHVLMSAKELGQRHALINVIHILPSVSLIVANVHLDFSGGTEHRRRQLLEVIETLDDLKDRENTDNAVEIICGDFNTMSLVPGPVNALTKQRNIASIVREAETRGFINCTKEVPWTQDIFATYDPRGSLYSSLKMCQSLGLHWRQKLDHIFVRGAKKIIQAGAVLPKGMKHLPGSDHLPVYAKVEI